MGGTDSTLECMSVCRLGGRWQYLGVHEYEGQLGDELAGERAEVQLHLHAIAHDDTERVALLRVQQPATTTHQYHTIQNDVTSDNTRKFTFV